MEANKEDSFKKNVAAQCARRQVVSTQITYKMAPMDQLPHQNNFPLPPFLSGTTFPLYTYLITLLSGPSVPNLQIMGLAQ